MTDNEQNIENDIEKQVENIEKDINVEISVLKDQLLRALAETDNVRKRSERDIEEAAKFAVTSFAKDLINVMENLYRATDSIPQDQLTENPLVKNIYDGVEMTKKELTSVFERHGIKRIHPNVGDQFDHNFHQVVSHIEDDQHPSGMVAQILQAGYIIRDRLLRPAMVIVTKEKNNNA